MTPLRASLRQSPAHFSTALIKSQDCTYTPQWADQSHNTSAARPYNGFTSQPYIPPGYIQLHHPSSHYPYVHHQANSVSNSPISSREVTSPLYSNGPVHTFQYTGYPAGDEYQRVSPSQQYPYTKQVTHHLRHLSDSSSSDMNAIEDKIIDQTARLKRENEY